MANILEDVQNYVVGKLSGDYILSACPFLAENRKDIDYEIKNRLGKQGIVGLVMTPKATYAGKFEDLFLSWTLEELEIDIVENVTVNRGKRNGFVTGQDAAMRLFDVLCPLSGDFEGQFLPVSYEEGEDGNLIVNKCVLKALVYGEHGDVPQPEKPITYQFVKLLDQPPPLSVQPHDGWMWQDADGLYFYVDHVAHKLGDVSLEQLSAYVESQVSSKVEISTFNELQNSLSDYYTKSETSSSSEISIALDGKQPTGDYALTSQLPTKISELSNDSGYITSAQVEPESALAGYAKNSYWAMLVPEMNSAGGEPNTANFFSVKQSDNEKGSAATVTIQTYASWFMSYYNGTTFDPPIELKWGYCTEVYIITNGRKRKKTINSNAWFVQVGDEHNYVIKATQSGNLYVPVDSLIIDNTEHPVTYTDLHKIEIATIDGQSGVITCARATPSPLNPYYELAYRDEVSSKADLSALNAVENSLSNYYTKNETSSNAEISAALNLKQDKLTNEQMANVNTKCLPLNLSGNTEISGSQYLDFRCLARFFSPVVMNGALDVKQLNIVNYEVDSYTSLSAIDEDTIEFVGGFNREYIAVLNLKNGTIAYVSDIEQAVSSKADLSVVESTLSNYYTKSETSSNTEISTALSLKQDKLSDAQLSSINNVVDERKTYFTFPNNEVQSVYVEGMLDTNYLQQLNPELSHDKILTATEVKIGTAVTGIAQSAFNGCSNLTKVTIPDSVVTIGEMAFGACYALVSLEIPDGVSTINNLFNYTDVHADVVFGTGLQSISQGMFHYVNPSSVTFNGKTLAEVQAMTDYPWDIEDTSIIKTYNIATQEWVLEQLSALSTLLQNQ